jgi:hypothetical protein
MPPLNGICYIKKKQLQNIIYNLNQFYILKVEILKNILHLLSTIALKTISEKREGILCYI